MPDYSNQGYGGAHQPPGYMTPAESNENAIREANKRTRSKRNPSSPREFVHRIKVPPFMDERRIKALMEEGLAREQAVEELQQEWLES